MSELNYLNSLFSVKDKVALITGGRRGLGLGMSQALGKAGAKVAIAAKNPHALDILKDSSFRETEVEYFQVNLDDRYDRLQLTDKVVNRFGRIDILVNCAGIQHRQPAIDFSLEKWDQIISIMLTSIFELSQNTARVMMEKQGGKIINIASLASFQGGWTVPAYTSAKHGIVGLTKALANEWAVHGINVNAIAPGYFDTDMCEAIINDPAREQKIRERIPVGRWGRSDDLAGALLFLASDASSYVNGHVLVVDGGWMVR
jgi:2-dehydro-3-deoxy-D-gluconate 5-dehydrogenase